MGRHTGCSLSPPMDYLHKFTSQVRARLLLLLLVNNVLIVADWYIVDRVVKLTGWWSVALLLAVPLLALGVLPWLSARTLVQPTKLIWQAILHVVPGKDTDVAAPAATHTRLGRELVTNLIRQVYQLATLTSQTDVAHQPNTIAVTPDAIIASLPLPLFLLDNEQIIVVANEAASKYLQLPLADITGKNLYTVLDMSFPSEQTFDTWLAGAKAHSATATNSWERVRLNPTETRPRQLFDLAAYYNRDNPSHIETMLVLFDHTKQYSQDDQAISFIALSVHELRTPLTLLRGYIEAFEDEFAGKLNPEMHDFMFKMSATAQQLTAFVNNILNVARVDDDQLVLQLHEEQWGDIVRAASNGLALRARVRGITLEYSIAPNLPTVGVDRVSIIEVINNLVDNAIKYSGKATTIRISTALNREGLVETTVQDFGVGIPANIISNLFTKFYRDHHNRAQIGGTGLGLYLSRAIVKAHGGNIWVKSKLGEGSTFGFTLVSYAQLADEIKNSDNKEIVRGAHGWIKNHSLYRR